MSSDRELLALLAAADHSLKEERLPPRGVRRIANELSRELDHDGQRRKVGWVPMATFMAGAVLVLVFLAWVRSPSTALNDDGTPANSLAQSTATVTGDNCEHERSDRLEVRGACQVVTQSPSMRIETIESARVTVDDRVLRVHQGSALFDVDKVVGSPVRVVTPAGEIVVIGTRFRVVVTGQTGQIDLYEGQLEFHANDGTVTPIAAGQRLEFGQNHAPAGSLPASAAAVPQPSAPPIPAETVVPVAAEKPTPQPPAQTRKPAVSKPAASKASASKRPTANTAVTSADDAGALIEQVQRLRRQGKFAEAATQLRHALRKKWPSRTADVLSNELGRILARRLDDPKAACAHWRKHLSRFPQTRYRKQIERSMSTLSCL